MTVECDRIDAEWAASAPFSFTVEGEIPATPERIFEIWLDPDSWPRWVDVIRKVTWTSEPPVALGATRSVEMVGGFVGHEEFVVWEPPERMAFRFNSTSKPALDAFLEDYRVIDLGDGTSVVRWTMSMAPQGPGRHTMKLVAPFFPLFLRRTLRKLARYAAANP
jgi:uncharacterized protein YndB with AHSA1/START domain